MIIKCEQEVNRKYGLTVNNILRGFVLFTSMGCKTVICDKLTVGTLQNVLLLHRIASSQKKAIVCHTRYVMIV